MPTRTIANGGGNWNAVGTWVEGAVPTAADDVRATATSGNVVVTATSVCRSLDLSLYVGTLSGAGDLSIGDAVGGACTLGGTLTGTWTVTFKSTSNNSGPGWPVVNNGKAFPGAATFNGVGGKWVQVDDFACAGTLTATTGAFVGHVNGVGRNITAAAFWFIGAGVRTVDITNCHVFLSAAAGTVLNAGVTPTNLTLITTGSTVTMTGDASSASLGAQNFGSLIFEGSGVSAITAHNGSTLQYLTRTQGTLTLTAGATLVVVNPPVLSGTTLNSSIPGTPAIISCVRERVVEDSMTIQDSTATGGAVWYAGANSVNVSGNTGWVFAAPPSSVRASNDYLNLVAGGVRQRIDSYRFDLVDTNGNTIGTVQPDRGHPCRIDHDVTRTVMRTLTNFVMDAKRQASLDTASARIRPSLVLQNGASYPMGVFLFGDATRPRRSWGLELNATLVDQSFILAQPVGRTVGYATGTNVVAAAVALAQEVIKSPIIATVAPVTLSGPLGWKVTDTRTTIISALLALVGYFPPYFNNAGALVFRPVPAPPLTSTVPAYELATRIVKDSIVESDDQLKAPNRYVVIETGAGAVAGPITATYDLPASSPNSIAARGFPIVRTLEVQGLADSASAAAAAQAAANSDPAQYRHVSFDSTHDARHDTFDVVTLLGNQYRETAWSVDLRSGGRMKHSLVRIYL